VAKNGIIETSTGDLLRAGYTTFTAGAGETARSDVPEKCIARGNTLPPSQFDRWNGTIWVKITQPDTRYWVFGTQADPSQLSPDDLEYMEMHHDETIGDNGDLTKIEWFMSFVDPTYSDKAVVIDRAYTRDGTTGIVCEIALTITYYYMDDAPGVVVTMTNFYPDENEGLGINEQSRVRLLIKAREYLFDTVGKTDGLDFLSSEVMGDSISGHVVKYQMGDRETLIDAVEASNKSYMTQTVKDAVNAILTYT